MINALKKLLSYINLFESLGKKLKKIRIKKRWLLIFFGLLLIALFIFWRNKNGGPDLELATVIYRDLTENVAASGQLKSEEEITLKFQTSGRLAWVGVKEGDFVKKWQAVASLDKKQLEKSLKQELIDFQNERWNWDQDQDDYEETALTNDIKRILEKAQFDLDRTILDVEIAHLAVKYATLISPIEGIMTEVDVPVAGVNVTPATATFTVANPNKMIFQANVDETEIGKVVLHQKAKLLLDAYPEEEIEVEVYQIGFTATTTSGGGTAFPVKVKLPENINEKYKLGMNGDLEVIIAKRENILTVPFEAVIEEGEETYVWVKTEKEAEKRPIKSGFSDEVYTQIIDGLKENEEVVISGFKQLEKRR